MAYTQSVEARFWSKVAKEVDQDKCWVWMSNVNTSGYGTFCIQRKGVSRRMFYAHRIAYEISHGPIPDGQQVCHRCDNKICVNQRHLFLGDRKANMQDAVSKGRMMHGSDHLRAKLTDQTALAILSDARTQEVIAQEYGIRQMTVSDLKRGKTWKHLPR